mmetsp:Transcript_17863/g.31049  ORF Transcript_17863/g.31049 Transcript_17863/m.31049 type:complete len:364 (+) Transcript_17863:575-1666(+)
MKDSERAFRAAMRSILPSELVLDRHMFATRNQCGMMFGLNPFIQSWVDAFNKCKSHSVAGEMPHPLGDIGACYGINAFYAVTQGAYVVAIDTTDLHLNLIKPAVKLAYQNVEKIRRRRQLLLQQQQEKQATRIHESGEYEDLGPEMTDVEKLDAQSPISDQSYDELSPNPYVRPETSSLPLPLWEEMDARLSIAFGSLPSDIPASPARDGLYSGLLVSEVFHFLTGEQVDVAMGNLFKALCPGGLVIITAIGHGALGFWKSQASRRKWAEFASEKMKAGVAVEWDTTINPEILRDHNQEEFAPAFWQTFDKNRLSRCAVRAGFDIVEAIHFDNHAYQKFHNNPELCREFGLPVHVALIAKKPL